MADQTSSAVHELFRNYQCRNRLAWFQILNFSRKLFRHLLEQDYIPYAISDLYISKDSASISRYMLVDQLTRKWLETSDVRGRAIEQFNTQNNSENQYPAKPITNELNFGIV